MNIRSITTSCLAVAVIFTGLIVLGCGRADPSGSETDGSAATAPSEPSGLEARSELLPVDQKAPDFTATDQAGETIRLSSLLQEGPVVLVFYPKDNTPTCTAQLCAVRDDWAGFQARGASVLGVNPADRETHADFAEKNAFPFPVLSDTDARIAAAYGAAGTLMVQRTVYVIDRAGTVRLAERGVVPHEHIFAALDRP